ncbi:MAG: response regulator [Deltaproteobacteria bacterium]|nr:response regulator [Deltaproteobacteria bacterium]
MKVSAHRMADLTAQLSAYARGGKYYPEVISLSDFMEEALPLIQHTINPAVRVETDLPRDVLVIEADRTQMQMVLSALMANADEAIDDQGRSRIIARNQEINEGFARRHGIPRPGPYVSLTVEDDGKGMDKETRTRIFDPFFTTRFFGRGLGMAAVYGIIRNHDGSISVDSELGRGTAVTIYLPAISPGRKEQGGKAVKTSEVDLPTGEGTVLVIEDEEPLVKLFRPILERLGYRVLQARTGKEAVEIARTFDGQIDLALLDIKLPDMSGNDVYPLIMEARPDLKVIVCNGHSIDGSAREILAAGAGGFIQKPFSIPTLAKKLKEVLEV